MHAHTHARARALAVARSSPIRSRHAQLGDKAFRTACSITVGANLETTLATLKRKLLLALENPQSTIRLVTQGDRYWYSDAPAAEIIEQIVMVDEAGSGLSHAQRLRDGYGECAVPASVVVCEPIARDNHGDNLDGTDTCLCTWLFRHDVLDGWRVLRYLTSLLFEATPLTLDRLRQRHEQRKQSRANKPSMAMTVLRTVARSCGVAALMPAAASRLALLGMAPSEVRAAACGPPLRSHARPMHMHMHMHMPLRSHARTHARAGCAYARTVGEIAAPCTCTCTWTWRDRRTVREIAAPRPRVCMCM